VIGRIQRSDIAALGAALQAGAPVAARASPRKRLEPPRTAAAISKLPRRSIIGRRCTQAIGDGFHSSRAISCRLTGVSAKIAFEIGFSDCPTAPEILWRAHAGLNGITPRPDA
jgi:hypothetical protein